jgi:signal transduction histidine kinase/ActR/RegA family two-component response regulator
VLREGTVVGLGNHTLLTDRFGTERPIDDSAAPIRDRDGAVAGVVMVFRDVTERKRAERAERAALESAQAANRAKDHFLAVLSHELRTPLTPALLVVSSLADDPNLNLPAEARAGLDLTRHNLELEARLIDDLLDVTRLMRGKLELKREPVDVHALVGRVLEICRSDLDAAGLEVATDLSARRHTVVGDPARLLQVLWNLVRNALKFTPRGGLVRVASRNEDEGGGTTLVVEVLDSGVGIEPTVLAKIFDPFEQGEPNSWTRRAGGLGLGLTIARSIVRSLGGELTADSPGPYQGSTFAVRLATIAEPAPHFEAPTPPRPARPRSAGRLRLLLVEDDEATARVLTRLLRSRGHDVTAARTVAEALKAAQAAEFDLVISDIGLPDGNGLELMRRLRATRPLPGIALSGFGMDDDVRKSREAGFREHLTKPVDFDSLEATLLRVAAHSPDEARTFAGEDVSMA